METIRASFETNVFGPMQVIRAVLPHFQKNGGGLVVNITSGSAIVPEPLMAIYSSTKSALDSFIEATQWEMQTQNVILKLVEPGFVPGTQLVQQTRVAARAIPIPPSYQAYVDQRMATYTTPPPFDLGTESDVAAAVFAAATDTTGKLRFIVGADTEINARMRFETSEDEYNAWTRLHFAPK